MEIGRGLPSGVWSVIMMCRAELSFTVLCSLCLVSYRAIRILRDAVFVVAHGGCRLGVGGRVDVLLFKMSAFNDNSTAPRFRAFLWRLFSGF